MTKREEQYDGIIAPGVDYIRSAEFKVHVWDGQSKEEVAARDRFFHNLLHRQVPRGDDKDKRLTSLADTIRWIGPTFDVIYAKEVENGAKLDALTKAFTGAIAALVGGQTFDQEKFLASVQEVTAAGVEQGLAGMKVSGQLVDGRLELAKES